MPWKQLLDKTEILAIHAAYMGFGQILYYGGDEHDPDRSKNGLFQATRLYDCNSGVVTKISSPHFDAFCSGHAFLWGINEVKFLVGGGTYQFNDEAEGLHHPHFPGLRDASIFSSPNFASTTMEGWTWSKVERMNTGVMASAKEVPNPDPELTGGRWYPTFLTLPNGNVIAFSGHPGSSDMYHNNDIPEIFSRIPEPFGVWRRLASYYDDLAQRYYQTFAMPLYPRVHLLPSGDIICTNPLQEGGTYTFLPDIGPYGGAFTRVCNFPSSAIEDFNGFGSTSVLLPLRARENFRAKVMICGGTSKEPLVLDLKAWKPSLAGSGGWQWIPTSPRAITQRRVHAIATILPTGEILVSGGIDVDRGQTTPDAQGVLQPEIYDPYKNNWTAPDDDAKDVRNYHSVAILMPDGRVWHAGSDRDAGRGPIARNLNIEIYEPWYFGDPGRPYINAAPSLARPGETIYLESTFASEVERVVLVRCGSCTHAFNPDQRLIELRFSNPTGDVLLAEMPPDNFILPPGPYFIYTIRRKDGTLGLPSFGTDIYIVPEKPQDAWRPKEGD